MRDLSWPRRLPRAPRNVRVVLAGGEEVAVELAYRGRDERGVHRWVSTQVFGWPLSAMHADMIPARTVVLIQSDGPP